MKKKIEDLIEKEIRKHFIEHGGNIEVLSVENDILKFKLTGQCCNCPSAAAETEDFVAVKIKEAFPQIKDVILVTGVSDDLIAEAKRLLSKGKGI